MLVSCALTSKCGWIIVSTLLANGNHSFIGYSLLSFLGWLYHIAYHIIPHESTMWKQILYLPTRRKPHGNEKDELYISDQTIQLNEVTLVQVIYFFNSNTHIRSDLFSLTGWQKKLFGLVCCYILCHKAIYFTWPIWDWCGDVFVVAIDMSSSWPQSLARIMCAILIS